MSDFDFPDESPRRRREVGHGRSAFATTFGGSIGCAAAVGALALVAFLAVGMMCAGCVGLGFLGQQTQQTQPAK
jgi:hypothetical protein